MNTNHADLAFFTPGVKPMLHRFDSSEDHRKTRGDPMKTRLGSLESTFIAGRDSFDVAAIGEDRWTYTQRGAKIQLKIFCKASAHANAAIKKPNTSTTNNNQQQPTTTNNNQQQPTTTNNNKQSKGNYLYGNDHS